MDLRGEPRREGRADRGLQVLGRLRGLSEIPEDGLAMVRVEVRLLALLARVDDRLPEALGEARLPVGPRVVVGEVGDEETCATDVDTEMVVDHSRLGLVVEAEKLKAGLEDHEVEEHRGLEDSCLLRPHRDGLFLSITLRRFSLLEDLLRVEAKLPRDVKKASPRNLFPAIGLDSKVDDLAHELTVVSLPNCLRSGLVIPDAKEPEVASGEIVLLEERFARLS